MVIAGEGHNVQLINNAWGMWEMKKLILSSTLVVLLLGMVGCSGSSSSGSSLNVTGTWMIYPHSTSTAVVFNNFQAVLQQSGSSVNSTSVVRNAPPGTVACSTGPITVTGSVAGTTFNGILRSNNYQASFSVSGSSSSMSGTFTINISSGPCAYAGTVVGSLTMTKG